jgi:hypothetical protein
MNLAGLILVYNEDHFVERALLNVLPVCGHMIVADQQPTDRPTEIVARPARQHAKIEHHRSDDPAVSHGFVRNLVGTDM